MRRSYDPLVLLMALTTVGGSGCGTADTGRLCPTVRKDADVPTATSEGLLSGARAPMLPSWLNAVGLWPTSLAALVGRLGLAAAQVPDDGVGEGFEAARAAMGQGAHQPLILLQQIRPLLLLYVILAGLGGTLITTPLFSTISTAIPIRHLLRYAATPLPRGRGCHPL